MRPGRCSTSRPARGRCRKSCGSSCAPIRLRSRPSPAGAAGALIASHPFPHQRAGEGMGGGAERGPDEGDLPIANERQAGLTADLVDDLQYPFAIGSVLYPELLNESAVVDQIISGNRLAAGLLVEGDLG